MEARSILSRGWCQHSLVDLSESHCLLGSLLFARRNVPLSHINNWHLAVRFIESVIHYSDKQETMYNSIVSWNDKRGRTKEEVLELMDEAIARSLEKDKMKLGV